MPLKYLSGLPQAVSIVGMVHGLLFTAYALFGLMSLEKLDWGYGKLLLALIIASLPFGPFLFERQLFPEKGGLVSKGSIPFNS